jgi:hypothetical protein
MALFRFLLTFFCFFESTLACFRFGKWNLNFSRNDLAMSTHDIKPGTRSLLAAFRAGSQEDDEARLKLVFAKVETPAQHPAARGILDCLKVSKHKFPVDSTHSEGGAGAKSEASKDGKKKGEDLEERIITLAARKAKLTGEIDLTKLPQMLVSVDISGNNFVGPVVLSGLPHTLQYFNCSYNAFSGQLSFSGLPSQLTELHLEYNRFTGLVDPTELPMSIQAVYLQGNCLEYFGQRVAPRLPANHNSVEADTAVEGDPGQSDPFSPPSDQSPPKPAWGEESVFPVAQFDFSRLPFKLRVLNLSENRWKHKIDPKGARKDCTVFLS